MTFWRGKWYYTGENDAERGEYAAGKTDEEIALAGIDAMQAFFASMGMPATLEQAGGCREDIPALTATVVNGRTGRFVTLLPEQIMEVYALACEK